MNTHRGIALETWVNIDGDCPIECEMSRTDAQIALGHGTGSLHLVLSEAALSALAAVTAGALHDIRAPRHAIAETA
jgi:hypothetical protein